MIDKMSFLCSSIPLFNALSDLLTELERPSYNHFIKHTPIDPFLGFLCAGTRDLVSDFIQQTSNTLWPFGRRRAMPSARRRRISALDPLECPYPDWMGMYVWRGYLQHHLGISLQGQPPQPASQGQSHPPHRWLCSPHRQSVTETAEPDGSISNLHSTKFWRKPTPMMTASSDRSHNPIL